MPKQRAPMQPTLRIASLAPHTPLLHLHLIQDMTLHTHFTAYGRRLATGMGTLALLLLAACQSVPTQPAAPAASKTQPVRTAQPADAPPAERASQAYRTAAAKHVYARNASRIYQGKLPRELYAIGVLSLTLDKAGQVQSLHWARAPQHAPEVVAEIERIVRASAPFPPSEGPGVIYTETWLWDQSGRFQLDTLSEGQEN